MDAPTSTGIPTQPEPIKPWKQVAEESNIFSLPAEQRVAEYDKWSQQAIAKGIRDGDFDSPDTFSQFKLLDIRTRKNLASDDIVGPSDEDILADYNSFSTAFQNTQQAFASRKPTPEDNAIQDEVLKGKRNAAFVRGQMVFNPTIVNDPQKYREAILESDAPPDIKMLYAGLRPEMEKSATITRRRELANSVITRDVADKVVNAIQEGTEVFGVDVGTPQSPALKKNKEGVWSVVDPEYSDIETSLLARANAKINPLADAQYKPLAAINEYQKKYGLSDEQVQQDYMEALIENAPTAVNRWVSKATSVEDYVKQLDSTVRVKNKDVAPEVRVQDPNLFFDEEGYNAAVDKANAPEGAKNLAKAARTQFADAVAGDIYNNLLANRDDFREDYAKDVVERKDMAKAITRYYKDKKDQAWYDDVGEFIGQTGTALEQGGMNVIMTPSAVLGMFGSVKDAEDVRYATMVQNGQMQAEEAVANRTGGAGAIKLTGDVARILPDLAVQMAIGIMSGGALSYSQAAALSARTGISKAAARTAIRQAAITGEKAALKTELAKLIPNLSAQAADDVATGALEAAARTMSNNPLKGGIGTQRAIGSAYAGLTSAGSTFGQVYTEVRAMGKSPEESIGIARTAGITAGAITGALTHTFGVLGRGGVEDFASMGRKAGEFTIRDIVKSGVRDVLTTQEGRQLARSIASGIAKDALHEGVEEGLDQALNLISQYATNPSPEAQNRKVSDVINESLYAGLLGFIAGGGANVVEQARATAPGITAQQMQAEILGSDATVAPDVAPPENVAPNVAPAPEPTPAPAPIVQSADPVIQEVAETAKAIADVPDTSQTAAALEALAKAAEAGLPKPEFNLPVVEKAPENVAPNVAPQSDIAPTTASPTATFVTELGSVYTVSPDGTTERVKAERNLPGHEGDKGKKERSVRTVYFDTSASALSIAGVDYPEGAKPRVVLKDGTATLTWISNGRRGAEKSATKVPFYTEPAVGRFPLELWQPRDDVPGYEAYAGMHAGNRIVEIRTPPTEPAEPANAEKVPVEQPAEPATVEPTAEQPNEEMKTTEEMPLKSDFTWSKSFSDPAFLEGMRSAWRELFGKPAEAVTIDDIERVAVKKKWANQTKGIYIQQRKPLVEAALREGLPVPNSVLADYKDLAPAPAAPAPAEKTAASQIIPEKTLKEISAYPDFSDRVTGGGVLDASEVSRYLAFRESTTSIPKADVVRAKKDLKNPTVSEIESALSKYAEERNQKTKEAKDISAALKRAGESTELDIAISNYNQAKANLDSAKVKRNNPIAGVQWEAKLLSSQVGDAQRKLSDAGKKLIAIAAKQPKPTKSDAVQEPKPDEGVLRQERPEVGLPEVDQGGRGAEQESAKQAEEVKGEVPPQQQDVVVFMDEQNDEQEERQKPKKKRITPGEARKAGIAKQIGKLGIQSNDPESVIGALKKIAAKPPQPHHARIAKDLISVLEGSETSIVLVASNDPRIKKGDERVNGWYDPATNTAYINLDGPHELGIEETILHELVHASGEKVIRDPRTEAQKGILGDLQKQMEAATKNAIAFGQSVLKTKETDLEKLIALAASKNNYGLFDILYGVSSLSEYHAHATTSKAFQRFLSEYKEGSKRNFFERFVNSITRLLSGQKTAEGSDAEKSYATLLDLMRENKGDVRLSNTDAVESEQAVSVEDVVTEPIPESEAAALDALPDEATVEDIADAAPKLMEQSNALAIKFKDFASWSAAATKAFGSKAIRFLETIWTGLKSISIAAIIGYTSTGVDSAFAPSIQEIRGLPKEDAISAAHILSKAPKPQETVTISLPDKRPTETAKPPTQKAKTTEEKIAESLSSFDSSVSNYVDFIDDKFESEILGSVALTSAMKAVAPLVGEMEGNRQSGPNKTLAKIFEVGGILGSQDEVPWCAMFISHGLNKAGIPTQNVMASQFLSFGKRTSSPKVGDVVVFNKRNDDNTISEKTAGHVGFFIRESGDFVLVLNGNVGDSVAVTALPKRRVMQYRSAPAARTDVVQSRARGRFDLVDAVRAASSGDASTPFVALNEAINANTELTRRIQAESERRSRAYARGKGAILEQIIRAGNTGRLPQESIKPLTDFVNSVSAEALADTRISLSARPQNSTFDFTDSLVTLALNGLGSDPNEIDRTGVHEFWHGFSRFIPDDEIEKMRVDYVAAVKEYISENPWFVPFIGRTHLSETQYDELSRLLSKDEMDAIPWKSWETLDDGRRIRGIKWSKENYRLFRLDEWVAETMADLVRRKQERPTTILGKMARLFRDFIDTLKQALGNPYLRALDAMTMPDEAFDAVIQRYGPIEDNPPVMYGGPAVGMNNQFILGMYAGEKALENLPEEARAFKRDSLQAARAMAAAGKTSEEIRAVTGWFPGKYDGKMRWEIPDNKARFVSQDKYTAAATKVYGGPAFTTLPMQSATARMEKGEVLRLGDIIEHPELFAAYPEAKNIPFFPISGLGSNASFRTVNGKPMITATVTVDNGAISDDTLKSVLHEIQHYIQTEEGFAIGGSANDLVTSADLRDVPKFREAQAALIKYRKSLDAFTKALGEESAKKGFAGFGGPNKKRLEFLNSEIASLTDSINAVWAALKNGLNIDQGSTRASLMFALSRLEDTLGPVWYLSDRNKGLDMLYRLIAGEIEARDVEARQSMTPEQRAAIAPYSSENIAPDEAIVLYSKARGIVSDAVVKFAPQFNVVDAPDGPSVEFDGRSVTVNPEKLENLEEYEVKDLSERAVVAAKAAPKDPIAAGIIQRTMDVAAYNFDSESRKGIRKSLADAHRTAHEFGMAPLAMELGNRLFEFGGATDADVRKSMARGVPSDEEYADAYKRGDTDAAQDMVDKAAENSKFIKRWNFSEKIQIDPNRNAFYTTSSKEAADSWGEGRPGKTRQVFISSKSPAIEGKNILSSSFMTPELVGKLRSAGFDSASGGRDWKRGDEIAVFSPEQIKSADPFTFDDAGELIPLSQRFQSDSPDIRYSRARGTELVTRVSGPALAMKKFISGFRSRGMVSQETYDAYRDSDAFKKASQASVSFWAKDMAKITDRLFGEGDANYRNFRVFYRDPATGEASVSFRGFDTRDKAEAFAVTNRYKDYVVSTGNDMINMALGSNEQTLKEDVRDAIEKLTKKGLDGIANSIEAYKEEYLNYWNLVVLETQADMVDPAQIATLRDRREQWMAALRLRSEEQKKLVDDARKEAVVAALADAKHRIVQQQKFAKAYLPDNLVHQIERGRGTIDKLSSDLRGIKWLMEGSENEMIIEGLDGIYVTRSYEAFETSDKAKYVAWLNEAYSALTNSDQVYDPLAMERIMPTVRHIKNQIIERRIEDLKKENDQRQVDAIMEDLMADSRQVTQVDRVPGQPIEGTEYEQLIRAVAKRDLLRRRSDEKKRFVRDMMRHLDAVVGFGRNIGNRRKRVVALRKEANRIYNERYGDTEQQIIADMFGRPQGLQWALMTDDEAHDIANVERALSESPANLNGSEIWRSDLSGETHSSFYAAVNAEFKSYLDYIAKAPFSKTGANATTTENWRRLNDKILEHKSDIPAFLRTLWGEKDNPLLRVSDTILKQSNLVAVGKLYDGIAEIGKKEGWLIEEKMQATDAKYTGWVSVLGSKDNDQGYRTNPLAGKVTDPVMADAISKLLEANQPSNSAFKVISFVVGAALWNVTAGSVRAIARNLYSLPIFLMNSGILGAVINPTRWPIVAKNIVLASRIVQQSMEATGKVSGGQQITNKGFKLADKFWTGLLSVVAAQRPALYAMRGAASMAEIAGRIKEQPTGEAFQEIYLKAVRLGVANDNVQKEAIHRLLDIEEQAIRKPKDKNMGRFAKALKLEGAVGFGSYLLGTMKSTLQQRSQLYGAPDDFTKIMAWLNEMDTQANIHAKDDAQYKEWVGEDGLFAKMPDEFVKKAADNVTNLIQSHSRVWAHITQFKKMGFGALMAPFAAARAEFYRNAANAYIIAFKEMRSKNKKEQMNGGIRFASALMAHVTMGNAIGAVVKTVFSAFADDDEIVEGSPEYREAVRKLGPEYAKNKNATYILYKNGTFDWVDLSFANPFAFVWDSITAARRGATEKDVEDNIVVAMSKEILEENIGTFAKPQIALDAFAAIRTGYDPVRGVKIWDSQADSFTDKLEKSVSYYLKQAGAPGDYKDAMKIWKASRGVEENGRQYKVGTEVGAVFLGTSIRTVNITDALEQKLAQAKDTLGTRITPLYKAPLRNANDVEMEDVALAVQQYAKAHDQAVSTMQKSYKAAETLLRETPNAKTLLRNVMSSDRVRMSQGVERAVVTGKPSFPEFSDQTSRKMGDLGKKHGDPRLKVAVDTLKEYNQKKKNP